MSVEPRRDEESVTLEVGQVSVADHGHEIAQLKREIDELRDQLRELTTLVEKLTETA